MIDEEKRLCAMTADLVRLSERRYEPCYSDFLSESEQTIVLSELKAQGCETYLMWGGYENAQRVMLCVYPMYCQPDERDFPFTALNLRFRTGAKLTHRDFLGSLMALGLKRAAIGDIVIGEGLCTFFVKTELQSYVTGQIEKVGREGVTFVDSGVDLSLSAQRFSDKACTVTSLRTDIIVGECAALSRSKSQQTIKSGAVSVNARLVYDPDAKINDGDKVSIRGSGKFIVHFDGSMSKKGKYKIIISKYL